MFLRGGKSLTEMSDKEFLVAVMSSDKYALQVLSDSQLKSKLNRLADKKIVNVLIIPVRHIAS